MALSIDILLLGVPAIALTAFMLLGLDPLRLGRLQVAGLALAGGVGPLLMLLPFAGACLAGACVGAVPIFTLTVGDAVVALALGLDPLGSVIGLTVTTIGAAVMAFSVAYMADADIADLRRFFALMNLFLAAMLTMVLAADSIVLFLGWEMMGLCSYFLIAYKTTAAEAIRAGRKAFIMTRFADAMLLAALLLLFLEARSVRLDALIPAGMAAEPTMRAIIAWLLLGGALGKSAQVPFHTWLPSAMAGPTPVSALLHSATMVAAGAFLLMRFAPLMQLEPGVQVFAAVMGVGTALFGALLALFQQDVKRLLAYSSISQIGFMMLSIAMGAPEAAAAHFVVHAIFKSLLFLSAGDITHHSPDGTDLRALRGAWARKPFAYAAFVAGAASLAGLPVVTAGWWSKEAILAAIYDAGGWPVLWTLALVSATLTAAYAARAVMIGMTRPAARPGAAAEAHGAGHPISLFTLVPLAALGFGALAAGVLVAPIIHALGGAEPHMPAFTVRAAAAAPILGVALALALVFVPPLARGMAEARALTRKPGRRAGRDAKSAGRWARTAYLLSRGLRVDGLYQVVFVWPFVRLVRRLNGYRGGLADPVGALPVLGAVGLARAVTAPLAHDGVDRAWSAFAGRVFALWERARRIQTGRVRDYGLAMALGAAGLLMLEFGAPWR